MYNITYAYESALSFRKKDSSDETKKSAVVKAILATLSQRPLSDHIMDKFDDKSDYMSLFNTLMKCNISQTFNHKYYPYIHGENVEVPKTGKPKENGTVNPSEGYCLARFKQNGPRFVELVKQYGQSHDFSIAMSNVLKYNQLAYKTTLLWRSKAKEESRSKFYTNFLEENPEIVATNVLNMRDFLVAMESEIGEGASNGYWDYSKYYNSALPVRGEVVTKLPRNPSIGGPIQFIQNERNFVHSGSIVLSTDYDTCQLLIDLYDKNIAQFSKIEDGGLFYLVSRLDLASSPSDIYENRV